MESLENITIQLRKAKSWEELWKLAKQQLWKELRLAHPELWKKRGRHSKMVPIMQAIFEILETPLFVNGFSPSQLVKLVGLEMGDTGPHRDTISSTVRTLCQVWNTPFRDYSPLTVSPNGLIALGRGTPEEIHRLEARLCTDMMTHMDFRRLLEKTIKQWDDECSPHAKRLSWAAPDLLPRDLQAEQAFQPMSLEEMRSALISLGTADPSPIMDVYWP